MPHTPPLPALAVRAETDCAYPEPFNSTLGPAAWRGLGDHFGLTQFGVSLEVIPPGSQSSLRHSHSKVDEFVYVLLGELVMRSNDGETPMRAGDCMGFKADDGNAHHLVNRSNASAQFLVVGTRAAGDVVSYPDDDFRWDRSTGQARAVHRDGTPW